MINLFLGISKLITLARLFQEILVLSTNFFPQQYLIHSNALVLPYISYGILAWGKCGIGKINRIIALQKRARRIINHTDYRAHSNPLFHKHKTLKVDDISFTAWDLHASASQ